MEPVVLALEQKYGGKVDFIIADVDKEKALIDRFQVNTIPAFFMINSNGSVLDSAIGGLSQGELEAKIRSILK